MLVEIFMSRPSMEMRAEVDTALSRGRAKRLQLCMK